MHVESIAECSLGAFCNTFDLHEGIISLENQFLVVFGVAALGRFYCIKKELAAWLKIRRAALHTVFV